MDNHGFNDGPAGRDPSNMDRQMNREPVQGERNGSSLRGEPVEAINHHYLPYYHHRHHHYRKHYEEDHPLPGHVYNRLVQKNLHFLLYMNKKTTEIELTLNLSHF